MKGVWHFKAELPDGSIRRWTADNEPTHEGLRNMLDVASNNSFHGNPNPPAPVWYFGYIDTAGFTTAGFDQTDTLASHPGWQELSSPSRQRVASSPFQSIIAADGKSALKSVFDRINSLPGPFSSRGILFTDVASGSAGILWATADYNEGPQSLPAGTRVTFTYTIANNS